MLNPMDAIEIVNRLLARTKERKIVWEPYETNVEFYARTEHWDFYIKARDEDDAPPYIIEFWRRSPGGGRGNVKVANVSTIQMGPGGSSLEELYTLAKAQGLGIDSMKDDILKDLG